jgi:site-specific DNA recombinase
MSRRELKNMERSIKGIIDPIEDDMYQPAMKARMQELVQQKAEIEQTFHFAGIGCCVSAI